jgi:hypothetical protein
VVLQDEREEELPGGVDQPLRLEGEGQQLAVAGVATLEDRTEQNL